MWFARLGSFLSFLRCGAPGDQRSPRQMQRTCRPDPSSFLVANPVEAITVLLVIVNRRRRVALELLRNGAPASEQLAWRAPCSGTRPRSQPAGHRRVRGPATRMPRRVAGRGCHRSTVSDPDRTCSAAVRTCQPAGGIAVAGGSLAAGTKRRVLLGPGVRRRDGSDLFPVVNPVEAIAECPAVVGQTLFHILLLSKHTRQFGAAWFCFFGLADL